MRLRLPVSLLVLFALVVPLAAQEPRAADSASPEMIAAALQGQGVLFLRQKDTYSFTLKNHQVSLFRLENGGRLLIKATIRSKPSLELLNRYNEQLAVTTRAVRYQKGGIVLEAGLDCQLGVTAAALQKFLTRFGEDLAGFENFLAKQEEKAGKDDPKNAKKKVPLDIRPNSDDKEFIIAFPTNVPPEEAETAWKIVWDMETGKQAADQGYKTIRKDKTGKDIDVPNFRRGNDPVLFKVKKAYFKPGPKAPWIQVLEDAHPQEFYVPYYFVDTRFFDLRDVGSYVGLSAKEGSLVSQTLSKSNRVMAELRDRGVVYKHGDWTRRGEELTLWANFAAGNYTYLVEFGFHDDGTIVFRHAPTGWNYYSHFNASHMHGSYWRVGVKLGPDGNNEKNQVHVVRLPKTPKDQGDEKGKLVMDEITKESFVDWNAQEFTRLRVSNPDFTVVPAAKDRPALPIAYDLVTQVQGVARHERFKDEKFTLHDFWITRHDCPQKMYTKLGDYFHDAKGEPNPELLPLENQNVVLWHSSSGLHTPRSEDGILGGAGMNSGQALVYWTTFELRPRNLFLKTPIYRQAP